MLLRLSMACRNPSRGDGSIARASATTIATKKKTPT